MSCTLCKSDNVKLFFEKTDKNHGYKKYLQCLNCHLVFLDPSLFILPEQEKKIYDQHENDPSHEGYVGFLSQLTEALIPYLKKEYRGLDFGCGSGPAMHEILGEKGFSIELYDPIYRDKKDLLNKKYDFITCTEVIEHFHNPAKEFRLLDGLLKDKGSFLGVMTSVLDDVPSFEDWYYHKDPTHVCFYSQKTFEWIAEWIGWKIEAQKGNVAVFAKL